MQNTAVYSPHKALRQISFWGSYLRLRKSLSILFIPALAFTASGGSDAATLIILSGIVTLGMAATYSYNCLKDAAEDEDNPLHPNPLNTRTSDSVKKNTPTLLFAAAILFSASALSLQVSLMFLALAVFSAAYSRLKIKKLLLVKTISVSACYTLLFLACFLAFSPLVTQQALVCSLLIFMLISSYSIMSDMRDVEADRRHDFNTIPVRYGHTKAEQIIVLIFLYMNALTVAGYLLQEITAAVAIPFMMLMPAELYLVRYIHARNMTKVDFVREISFILISVLSLASNAIGHTQMPLGLA